MAEARLVAKVETKGVKAAKTELENFTDSAEDATQAVNNLDKQSQKIPKSAPKATKALGGFGRRAGQAGIQIQQFVGQVQGGQSAMVALSQQATDLGFVLGFPLAGAVAGITASFAGPLIDALFGAEEKVKDLEKEMKKLDKTMVETTTNTLLLTEEIEELAKQSKAAAAVAIKASLVEAALLASEALAKLEEETSGLGRSFIGSGTDANGFSQALRNQAKEYGITAEELDKLNKLQRRAISSESAGDVAIFTGAVQRIAAGSEDASDEFIKLAANVQQIGSDFLRTQQQIGQGQKFLEDLPKALTESTETALEDRQKAIEEAEKLRLKTIADSLREEERLKKEFEAKRKAADTFLQGADRLGRSELETIDIIESQRLDKLREFANQGLVEYTDFENAKTQILQESTNKRAELDAAARQQQLDTTAAAFGTFAELARNSAGEQSGIFKALFATQKAFALASTINNIAVAQGQAATDPTAITAAQKLANVALITSQLVGLIQAIQGNNFNARAQGGQFRAGQNLLVGENGPELVRFNDGGRIADAQSTSGMLNGGKGNITIVNQTTGRIDNVERRDEEGQTVLIVQEVLNREVLNPNSQFNKNLDRTRKVQRQF